MKVWLSMLSMAALLCLAAGCPKESEPGGPGVAADGDNETEETFTLIMPDGQDINQGGNVAETISIQRGDEFTEDVEVEVTPPAGITVEPASFTFSGETTEQNLTITADATVPAGDHPVEVTGTPTVGDAVTSEFIVTIEDVGADGPGVSDQPPLDPAPEDGTGTDNFDTDTSITDTPPAGDDGDAVDEVEVDDDVEIE